MIKFNVAGRIIHCKFTWFVLGRFIKNSKYSFSSGYGSLNLTPYIGKLVNRSAKLLGIYDKCWYYTDGYISFNSKISSSPCNNDEADIVNDIHYRPHRTTKNLGFNTNLSQFITAYIFLSVKCCNSLDASDHLLNSTIKLSQKNLPSGIEFPHGFR